MKLTGLTASLFTNQIDRALAFYRDMLGFTIKQTVPDQAPFVFVWLERDSVNVFLNDEALTRKEAPDATWLTVGQVRRDALHRDGGHRGALGAA